MRHSTRAWMPFSLQLLHQRVFHAAQELLALHAPRFHRRRHPLVAHRIGVAEGQVLQLAAHLAHAQPVRQRSVNVQRLARDRLLPLGLQVLQRAHVVQPVGQLDQHHAHIDTIASSILRTFSAWRSSRLANWILSILVTPSTMCATWSPKPLANLLAGGLRVLHGVVQQRRGDGRRVQLHLHQHLGYLERVHNVGLAAEARLPLVVADAELPRLSNQ